MKDLEFITIYPGVNVYRNVFKDVNNFLEKAKKCEKWEQWYTFGSMLALQEMPIKFDSFPTKEEYMSARRWDDSTENSKVRGELGEEVAEIFYDVTSHYIKMHPEHSLQNWIKNPASVNRYNDGSSISDNYSMNYHTDYNQEAKDSSGIKFGVTTTFYLNDDYQDGEICFKINDHYISHKPQKGDVIVFPSKPPYYHAVRKSSGTDRYMIRSFWQFEYEGSREWLENQEKYGKDVWSSMEEDRISKERFMYQIEGESIHGFFGKDNGIKL